MPKHHKIVQGQTISSLSDQYGLFDKTIWEHPDNAGLKTKRENPNVLLPGDMVVIPDKQSTKVMIGSDQRHRFLRKGIPLQFRLQVLANGQPRVKQPYTLVGDIFRHEGNTDDKGMINTFIPPKAKKAKLRIGTDQQAFNLTFGTLDPVSEMIGVQKRLNNLDFPCGKVTGEINDQTRAALKNFQRRLGMEVTGEIDQATREHLVKYHDTNESLPEEPQVTTTVKKQQAVEQVIEADLPTQPNAMTVEEGMNEEDFDI